MSEWSTAVHEAGHATASYLLGASNAGPVTIVPGENYAGCCYFGRARKYRKTELAQLGLPVILLPSGLKRYYEHLCMMLLAGSVAEDLHAGRGEPTRVGSAQQEPVPLPPREASLLVQADTGYVSDLSQVWKILSALHLDDEKLIGRHAAYLEAETESLLSGTRAKAMVTRLATALMVHKTLPARAWQAVLRSALPEAA